jgi:hypothetical protein
MTLSHLFERRILWSLVALLVFVSSGRAQYWFRYPRGIPYGGGGYGYGNQYAGPGGFLHGTANIISSTGDLLVKNQQAFQEQEKAKQAVYDTKRKAFNEMMYEKANTPTYTEEAVYKKQLLLHRIMTNPTPGEIARGDTLNTMMPVIEDLSLKGVTGPPIPLDPDVVREVNVTLGGQTGGNVPSLGMLKNANDLDWPIPVQGPKQEKLAAVLPKLVNEAMTGRIKAATYNEVKKAINVVQEDQRRKFHKEEIDGGEYLIGKRFMDKLEDSVKALQQPGTRRVLDGTYAARGNNVPELVNNMTSRGLLFAPANPGNEPAYQALHTAFVAYASSALSASGFQFRFNAPRTDPWVGRSPVQ